MKHKGKERKSKWAWRALFDNGARMLHKTMCKTKRWCTALLHGTRQGWGQQTRCRDGGNECMKQYRSCRKNTKRVEPLIAVASIVPSRKTRSTPEFWPAWHSLDPRCAPAIMGRRKRRQDNQRCISVTCTVSTEAAKKHSWRSCTRTARQRHKTKADIGLVKTQ